MDIAMRGNVHTGIEAATHGEAVLVLGVGERVVAFGNDWEA